MQMKFEMMFVPEIMAYSKEHEIEDFNDAAEQMIEGIEVAGDWEAFKLQVAERYSQWVNQLGKGEGFWQPL